MRYAILIITAFLTLTAFSQQSPNIQFGKLSLEDFNPKSYAIDTSAAAVVLYETGSTKIKGNTKGSFSLEFKIFRRVHILSKNGYDNATMEIPLYTNGEEEEKLDNVRASTYNLENGRVVETKLDNASIFKEKKNKNWVSKKFALPNVREGSIIEYEYQITSDFLFNLQPWNFQSDIPKLWSEYKVTLPQFLSYALISQGSQAFYINDRTDKRGDYTVVQRTDRVIGAGLAPETTDITCSVTDFRWAMKDVPPMKEEAYTSTTNNYVSRMEFQLAGYSAPLEEQKIMTTWTDLAERLLQREDFGLQLNDALEWLPAITESVIKGAASQTEKARRIYTFIRDQFSCTDHGGVIPEQTLRTVFKNKNGGVAEINMLLTAMLKSAGLIADPIILSTKGNLFVLPQYPALGRFNYVISKVSADGQDLLLDASDPQLGFAKLDNDCYNGQARVINGSASPIELSSDILRENETVLVNLTSDKTGRWIGHIDDQHGYFGSLELRKEIKKNGKERFFKNLEKSFASDALIGQPSIDSLDQLESPITLSYDISLGKEKPDIIYFDPIMVEKYKHNPFKSADRQYPVEIPYRISETYILNVSIPDGYVADEMPKPLTLKMDQSNDAIFEYSIAHSGDNISMRSRLQLNKTKFEPFEYNALREFFNRVVAKQNEQIVFKKKS